MLKEKDMFEKFLLSSVQELIDLRLAAYRECKHEDCLFRQFIRQVQEILLSEKLTENKKINKLMKLSK